MARLSRRHGNDSKQRRHLDSENMIGDGKTHEAIGEMPRPKTVTIASVHCVKCGLPNTLDADGRCSHCRIAPMGRLSVRRSKWWERFSVFKDRAVTVSRQG